MTSFHLNAAGVELEFSDLTLVEQSDTYVYRVTNYNDHLFFETVAEPTSRELVDALLSAWKAENVKEHSRRVRRELDGGFI